MDFSFSNECSKNKDWSSHGSVQGPLFQSAFNWTDNREQQQEVITKYADDPTQRSKTESKMKAWLFQKTKKENKIKIEQNILKLN